MTFETRDDLNYLFALANLHRVTRPAYAGRLMGRHARARLLRAQDKRRNLRRSHGRIVHKAVYTP